MPAFLVVTQFGRTCAKCPCCSHAALPCVHSTLEHEQVERIICGFRGHSLLVKMTSVRFQVDVDQRLINSILHLDTLSDPQVSTLAGANWLDGSLTDF